MNTFLAKLVVISTIPIISFSFIEKSVAKETNLTNNNLYFISQNSELDELKKLDELKRKQQEDIKKKLDVINNLVDSSEQNSNDKNNPSNAIATENTQAITEKNSSRFMLILTAIGGSTVVGIGGLLLLRTILLQFVSKKYKQKLKTIAPREQPWWNRPLFGSNNIFELLFSRYSQPKVPEDAISLHSNYMADLKNTASLLKSLDQEKFTSQDFLFIKD